MTGIVHSSINRLKYQGKSTIFIANTSAMPLSEAHFGGSFFCAVYAKKTAQNVAVIATFADTMHNTPAMPLNDAQIGGFFYARRKRA